MNSFTKNKKWEKETNKSWNILKELCYSEEKNENVIYNNNLNQNHLNLVKKKINSNISYINNFLKGLIIIIDLNQNLCIQNFNQRNKMDFLYDSLQNFIPKFFNQNFISNIVIIGVSDYKSFLIVPLSNDCETTLNYLKNNWPKEASGEFSIINSLSFCEEYISIMEDKKDEKLINYEIAFIINSNHSFDFNSYHELLQKYLLFNIEINIFLFNNSNIIPNSYQSLTKIVDGILLYGSSEEYNLFLSFLIYKKIRFTRLFINKVKIKFLHVDAIHKSNSAVCVCHSKLCSIYYTCSDCNSIYCKIPVSCKYCYNILINHTYFNLFKIFLNNNSFYNEVFEIGSDEFSLFSIKDDYENLRNVKMDIDEKDFIFYLKDLILKNNKKNEYHIDILNKNFEFECDGCGLFYKINYYKMGYLCKVCFKVFCQICSMYMIHNEIDCYH